MRRQSITKLRIKSKKKKIWKDYAKKPHRWRTYLAHKSIGWTNVANTKKDRRVKYEALLNKQKTEYNPSITGDVVCRILSNSSFVKNEKERSFIQYFINHGATGIGVIGERYFEIQSSKLRKWIVKENMKRKRKGKPPLNIEALFLN